MQLNRFQLGNALLGVFFGIVIGVLMSFFVVWMMNKTPLPFRDQGTQTTQPGGGENEQAGTVAPLPGKPAEMVGEKPGDKPRFEFYKILPGAQEAAPSRDTKAATDADTKTKSAEPLYLQVGAFQKPADADNLKARLALIGMDGGVQEVDLPEKGTVYRVRTGPFQSVEEMNQAKKVLSQNGIQASQVKGN